MHMAFHNSIHPQQPIFSSHRFPSLIPYLPEMPLFAFKSNNHFVASSDGIVLQVYELTKSSIHLSSIQKVDWKKVATIDTNLKDDDIDSMVPKMLYDGLLFFDGHGRIEGPEALVMLAKHLRQLHLLVSPEGYCFQEVSDFGVYSDVGIHYVRLNDLFSWPRHKVDLATTNVWSRLELKYSLPKHKNKSEPPTVGGGMSKEKYAELEMLMKEKLKEEMDEVNEAKEEELKMLKKANQDQQKQVQKKDKELQMLKKKKEDEEEANTKRIEELEKLNEDPDEANKAKDEELHRLAKSKNIGELQKQLKRKDDELRMLKKKKDKEEEAKAQRIGELEKLNEDLEEAIRAEAEKVEELSKLKRSDNELRKLLKMKDNELRVLGKKKDDEEEAKTSRYEEVERLKKELEMANQVKDYELRKLRKEKNEEVEKKEREKYEEAAKTREKLSSSLAQAKKELEEYRKKSWDILPGYTKFLSQGLDAKHKYLATRQPVPPGTFNCHYQFSFPHVSNSHKLAEQMRVDSNYDVKLVDEESGPAEWPPLPEVVVPTAYQYFDKNNWWYLKTTHPEGGLTMLVFYDGNYSRISHDNNYGQGGDSEIPLPYAKDLEVYTFTHKFSIFRIRPIGVRFGFTYRPKE